MQKKNETTNFGTAANTLAKTVLFAVAVKRTN
jgi:hypothetical protein